MRIDDKEPGHRAGFFCVSFLGTQGKPGLAGSSFQWFRAR